MHQPYTNRFCGGSVSYTATNCIALFLNGVCYGQFFWYVLVFNFTLFHAMFHRAYYFLAHCPRVIIWETVSYFIIESRLTASQAKLHSIQILTILSVSKSFYTLLLVVISLPTMNGSLFVIWATSLHISHLMIWEFQRISAHSIPFLEISIEMRICGDSVCSAQFKRLLSPVSYISFVINFFASHQNMWPAEWGNTYYQMVVFETVPNWRFGCGSVLEPNWNHWNGFYPIKIPNRTKPAVFWPVPHFCKLSTLAPTWYLCCDRITIWYILNRCSVWCSFNPILQFAIWSLFVEWLWNNTENQTFFKTTWRIVIRLQFW